MRRYTLAACAVSTVLVESAKYHGQFRERYAGYVIQDEEALQKLRSRRKNSGFFEETRSDNFERECSEEMCTREELREIFPQNKAKVKKLWSEFTEQCYLKRCNPQGTKHCVQTWKKRVCACKAGWEGDKCENDQVECRLKNGDLDTTRCKSNQVCVDTPGSFKCECKNGYENTAKGGCKDVDECVAGTHGCNAESENCKNTVGGYTCECKSGFARLAGESGGCQDMNECDEEDICDAGKVCKNTPGSFTCACDGKGYEDVNGECVDINECQRGTHTCKNGGCVNIPKGSWSCSCDQGYQPGPKRQSCVDIDDCITSSCGHGKCKNTPGGYDCNCEAGYEAIGEGQSRTCEPKCGSGEQWVADTDSCVTDGSSAPVHEDPCAKYPCGKNMKCVVNERKQASCQCKNKFYRVQEKESQIASGDFEDDDLFKSRSDSSDDESIHDSSEPLAFCVDIDECDIDRSTWIDPDAMRPCQKAPFTRCVNHVGKAHECACEAGFQKSESGETCEHENECLFGTHNCKKSQTCHDNGKEVAGFQCLKPGEVPKPSCCFAKKPCEMDPQCPCGGCQAAVPSTTTATVTTAPKATTTSYVPITTTTPPTTLPACPPGFERATPDQPGTRNTVFSDCIDIDECHDNPEVCPEYCMNYYGGYRCYEDMSVESEMCHHSSGSNDTASRAKEDKTYSCECFSGYHLCYDLFSCITETGYREYDSDSKFKYEERDGAVCEKGKFSIDSKCYSLELSEPMTYTAALAHCKSVGGALPKIRTRKLWWVLGNLIQRGAEPFWVHTQSMIDIYVLNDKIDRPNLLANIAGDMNQVPPQFDLVGGDSKHVFACEF